MSDYTSEGAVPIEDAAVDDPPTVDEVLEEQRRRDDLPDPSEDPRHQQVGELPDDDHDEDLDVGHDHSDDDSGDGDDMTEGR